MNAAKLQRWLAYSSLKMPPEATIIGELTTTPSALHFFQPLAGGDQRTSMVEMDLLGLIAILKALRREKYDMELLAFLVVVESIRLAWAAMDATQVFQRDTLFSNLALFLACQIW